MRSLASTWLACGVAFMLLWQALASAAEWDPQALMAELARRSSGRALFFETKYLAVLDEPLEQSGRLSFAPGRLEKFTQRPYQERMVVSDDTVSIEIGAERKQRRLKLHRYPALQGFIEGLRATLTGDLDSLRQFYEIELHGSREDWELVLVPSRPEMTAVVRLISIRGSFDRVSTIEVVHQNADRSVMRISEEAP